MTRLVTAVQDRILKILNTYDRLTREQVNRALGYKPSTVTTTWGHLKKLQDNGLVETVSVDLNPSKFSAPTKVYFVSNLGRKYLRSLGVETPDRKKIKEAEGDLSMFFWRHALAVNDFMISCALWERQNPDVEIIGVLNDIDIRRDPGFPIEGYSPDGWLQFSYKGKEHTICLELERGVYADKRWITKLERMERFSQVVDAENLVFLVIAMSGESHVKQLQRLTQNKKIIITGKDPTDLTIFEILIKD